MQIEETERLLAPSIPASALRAAPPKRPARAVTGRCALSTATRLRIGTIATATGALHSSVGGSSYSRAFSS